MIRRLVLLGAVAAVVWTGAAAPAAAQGNGEVWVTAQSSSRLFILKSAATSIETVTLPAGVGPHLTTFSPSGRFAYVAGMGNGDLLVLRADGRQIVKRLNLGPAGTHQARPSPSGSVLLVAQLPSSSLIKVAVDERAESWTVAGAPLSFAALGKRPICTVFRDDGQRAYVSLLPSGLAIVDVASMAVLHTLSTDGFIACGMIKSRDGKAVTIASSGSGGHLYRLDTATEKLADAGTVGAKDWHSFALTEDERLGVGTSPASDELQILDVEGPTIRSLGPLALDPTPGAGNDGPDNMSVKGSTVYVSLRASGKLAIVEARQRTVTYVDLAPRVPPDVKIPLTCDTCAVHGVTVRP